MHEKNRSGCEFRVIKLNCELPLTALMLALSSGYINEQENRTPNEAHKNCQMIMEK